MPKLAIAIVGSRSYPALDRVRTFVQKLPTDAVIVSGGAEGVDLAAEEAARARGMDTIIFHPNYKTHGRSAPFVRNTTIVDNATHVIAFWDGKSGGTLDTIRKACKARKPVTVIDPQGQVLPLESITY